MSWKDLLSKKGQIVVPWTGGRSVYANGRTFKIKGKLPGEHGWHTLDAEGGRGVHWTGATHAPFFEEEKVSQTGYVVGDRFVPDGATVNVDPSQLLQETRKLWLIEPGLQRFTRVRAVYWEHEKWVYAGEEFPLGPEVEVYEAFVDRLPVDDVSHLTPALHLAYNFECKVREDLEELARRQEAERLRIEAEEVRTQKRAELAKKIGTGAGRRELAAVDFNAAARSALLTTDAVLLDTRPGYDKNEMVVQYRFMNRRFECTCDRLTMRILDAGVCLGHGAAKGDRLFTLESICGPIREAIEGDFLVVYRHA